MENELYNNEYIFPKYGRLLAENVKAIEWVFDVKKNLLSWDGFKLAVGTTISRKKQQSEHHNMSEIGSVAIKSERKEKSDQGALRTTTTLRRLLDLLRSLGTQGFKYLWAMTLGALLHY